MILITGGTGFVGRRVARALVANGCGLVALTRSESHCERLPVGTRVVIGDMTDPASVDRALEGVDTVIHLAANLGDTSEPATAFRQNVEGTRLLASIARTRGVGTFLHVSSAGVYGDQLTTDPLAEDSPLAARSPYELSKLESEQALLSELSGEEMRWIVLRPPGIYGPGRRHTLSFVREVWRRPVWLHGATRVIVHPTHVDDVVSACMAVLSRNDTRAEVFNVGGERPILYQDLIALVAQLLPRRVWQISLPAVGGTINRAVSTRKAELRLGVHPRPLTEGMAECIASFRAEGLL